MNGLTDGAFHKCHVGSVLITGPTHGGCFNAEPGRPLRLEWSVQAPRPNWTSDCATTTSQRSVDTSYVNVTQHTLCSVLTALLIIQH